MAKNSNKQLKMKELFDVAKWWTPMEIALQINGGKQINQSMINVLEEIFARRNCSLGLKFVKYTNRQKRGKRRRYN